MLVPDRRRRVLDHVRRHGSAQVEDLAASVGVSPWTVRRDLAELERQGLLRRARGGAYVDGGTAPETPSPAGAEDDDARARIGALAASRIHDDTTIMLLAGSTVAAMIEHLHGRRLTVVTNGLEVAHTLRHAPNIEIVLLGGVLHRDQMTLLGPLTERTMDELHVDLIVAGAYGVHPDVGVTGSKIIQAGYHRGMLRHADGLMVLADATKLGRRGPTLLAELGVVDTLVTDHAADPALVERIHAHGPEILLA